MGSIPAIHLYLFIKRFHKKYVICYGYLHKFIDFQLKSIVRLYMLCYINVTKLLQYIINVSLLFLVISVMLQKNYKYCYVYRSVCSKKSELKVRAHFKFPFCLNEEDYQLIKGFKVTTLNKMCFLSHTQLSTYLKYSLIATQTLVHINIKVK